MEARSFRPQRGRWATPSRMLAESLPTRRSKLNRTQIHQVSIAIDAKRLVGLWRPAERRSGQQKRREDINWQKVALVTGVPSGIRRAIDAALCESGFRVFGTRRKPSEDGGELRNISSFPLCITLV